MSGFGAIFAVSGIMGLRSFVNIQYVYIFTSLYCLTVAIICAFGVKTIERKSEEKAKFDCIFRLYNIINSAKNYSQSYMMD